MMYVYKDVHNLLSLLISREGKVKGATFEVLISYCWFSFALYLCPQRQLFILNMVFFVFSFSSVSVSSFTRWH